MDKTPRLRFLYLTNHVEVARIAEAAGADYVFVDLEQHGKEARQPGLDTVKSRHTIDDVVRVRGAITRAELLVRVNPLGPWSGAEIDSVTAAGADVVMLPYFTKLEEAREFVALLAGRARAWLLLETAGAAAIVDDLAALDGVDMIFIGLNDLHLSQDQRFLFEPLATGQVDRLVTAIKRGGKKAGFGGIGRLGEARAVDADALLGEHVRLASDGVILARSFADTGGLDEGNADMTALQQDFDEGIAALRGAEARWRGAEPSALLENQSTVIEQIDLAIRRMPSAHG